MVKNKEQCITDYTEDQDEIKTALSNLIKEAIKENGLSVRELGSKADVSYTVIYEFLKKGTLPKLDTINRIINAINYDIEVKSLHVGSKSAFMLVYAPKGTIKPLLKHSSIACRVTTKKETLESLLMKKGLYADEIKEVENFIKFKLSSRIK